MTWNCAHPRFLIDWLSFTYPSGTEPLAVFAGLSVPDEFERIEKGRHGYKTTYQSGHIFVYTNGMPSMGPHVQLSGQGVRQYEQHIGGWTMELQRLLALGVKFTRIDVAFDTPTDTTGRMKEAISSRSIVTRFRNYQVIQSGSPHDTETGETIYLGSPQSMVKVRFYDKAKEQCVSGPWHRIELQLQKERAHKFIEQLTSGRDLGQLWAAVMNTYVSVREKTERENLNRCTVCSWWMDLLRTTEKIRLTTDKPKKDIEELKRWFERNMSPTLATLLQYKSGDLDYLKHLAVMGSKRQTQKHKNMLRGE